MNKGMYLFPSSPDSKQTCGSLPLCGLLCHYRSQDRHDQSSQTPLQQGWDRGQLFRQLRCTLWTAWWAFTLLLFKMFYVLYWHDR